jgi:Mn2+/Fe2+ NRAMP family transporter
LSRPRRLLRVIGPGLVVAATGVGAGDLALGAFAGSRIGLGVVWAVLVGAIFKLVLTEGLARYQLATGETLLEGVLLRVPRLVGGLFLAYLLFWSWFVGSALISACGIAAHALLPYGFEDPERGRLTYGVLHSLAGLGLVWCGGYRAIERTLALAVGVMALTVLVTAVLLRPDLGELLRGFRPTLPAGKDALAWTIALVGGVGGTVTILCYGYWIREHGREGPGALRTCRIDLVAGYSVTALFGLAMVVIGSGVVIEGRGVGLIVNLAERLRAPLGAGGRALFLLGAWAAVFSSLLGVWQSVPYLFADTLRLLRAGRGSDRGALRRAAIDTRSRAYRGFLVAIAVAPMLGLVQRFDRVQLYYGLVGASFLPLLALALLLLNGRRDLVGALRNRPASVLALVLTLAFFALAGLLGLSE